MIRCKIFSIPDSSDCFGSPDDSSLKIVAFCFYVITFRLNRLGQHVKICQAVKYPQHSGLWVSKKFTSPNSNKAPPKSFKDGLSCHIFRKIVLGMPPVSYTHLRAHETRHDLVCRLL